MCTVVYMHPFTIVRANGTQQGMVCYSYRAGAVTHSLVQLAQETPQFWVRLGCHLVDELWGWIMGWARGASWGFGLGRRGGGAGVD